MFSELVRLGRDLEQQGKLPPAGFYDYGEPVKWYVALWPDRARLVGTEQPIPRPYGGRTSDMEAHLLSDEAGYALGIQKTKGGGEDKRAADKHERFKSLVSDFLAWDGLTDTSLREALGWLMDSLDRQNLSADPRVGEILSKDWISYKPEIGPLAGQHLFEHELAKAYWVEVMQARCAPGEKKSKRVVIGQCAICGRNDLHLIGKIPLGVKLAGVTPLHSLNADAFTSFQSGADNFKHSHLGLCFTCGDTASRAFNYLSQSDQHRKTLAYDKDKRDSLANQFALFWLKVPAPLMVGEIEIKLDDLDAALGTILTEAHSKDVAPQATLSQLADLLKLPWEPKNFALRLDDYGFYLAVLSPNVGRIALREWIADSLEKIKDRLSVFLESTRIVSSWGDAMRPFSIAALLQSAGCQNPNFTRGLLRTAYLGHPPPAGLLPAAVNAFRNPNTLQNPKQDPKETWRLHALASLLKLSLYFGTKEVITMSEHDPDKNAPAYLCGSLLAILEEAQQVSHYIKHKNRLDTTIVNRFYGSTSTAPGANFGGLIRMAATAHLPDVGKDLNVLVENVMAKLDEAGGFPHTLTLAQQAEFGLGFYHQRAKFRVNRLVKNKQIEGDQ
jgi:CRISPR-associated protein Csd1